MKQRCYIALGSNLNNPIDQIQTALSALKKLPKSSWIKSSSLYLSEPVSAIQQPDYINAVAMVDTELNPTELLHQLQQIEIAQGRLRNHLKNAARVIDLDILLYGNEVITTPDLQIPHPRLHERLFVLLPLKEIAADLILPDGEALQTLIAACLVSDIKKVIKIC